MTKYLLPLFLICGSCAAGIVFQKEVITATIASCDTLEIQGIYFFVNSDTSAMSAVVHYPFPVDTALEYPHHVAVVRLSNRQHTPYVQTQTGITWQEFIPPRSTDSIQVVYRQKALHPNGRYILTTTQNWKRPLERADFIVVTPAGITLKYWSFQSDSVNMRNGNIIYRSLQTNFLPERDMLLEWNCEKASVNKSR
jgi:hypothetical protein